MDDCLVCGNEKVGGRHVCKMCGMKSGKGIVYHDMLFCSEKCRTFFIEISRKSPEMAKRNIVI